MNRAYNYLSNMMNKYVSLESEMYSEAAGVIKGTYKEYCLLKNIEFQNKLTSDKILKILKSTSEEDLKRAIDSWGYKLYKKIKEVDKSKGTKTNREYEPLDFDRHLT